MNLKKLIGDKGERKIAALYVLKGYKIIQGIRGEEGVNEVIFAEMVSRVATLCHYAPEIVEMDINPLLGNSVNLTAVDARIRIKRND